MLLRRGRCVTEERRVCCRREDNVLLRKGECVTEESTVCY